jgi:TrmH family RNA methyltransferase
LSPTLFAQIDVLGTHFNILVVAQPDILTLSATDIIDYAPKGIELIVPIGDPGNLGALIRSCEAFGVPRVILSREAAHPFLPKSVKASAGSVMRVPLARGPALAEYPSNCIALDTQGMSIDEFVWPTQGLLVVGEEGSGFASSGLVPQTRIRIPTHGVESLNAVVATSIALSRIPYHKKTK